MERDSRRPREAAIAPLASHLPAQLGHSSSGQARGAANGEVRSDPRPISSPLVTAIALALRAVERGRDLERVEVAA
jgi:hypothetical protein